LAKELTDFDFADTRINETLVRELAAGTFLEHQTFCCSPIMWTNPTSHSDVSDLEASNFLAEVSPPSEWRLIHINMYKRDRCYRIYKASEGPFGRTTNKHGG
jgi:hypothetical protein